MGFNWDNMDSLCSSRFLNDVEISNSLLHNWHSKHKSSALLIYEGFPLLILYISINSDLFRDGKPSILFDLI